MREAGEGGGGEGGNNEDDGGSHWLHTNPHLCTTLAILVEKEEDCPFRVVAFEYYS